MCVCVCGGVLGPCRQLRERVSRSNREMVYAKTHCHPSTEEVISFSRMVLSMIPLPPYSGAKLHRNEKSERDAEGKSKTFILYRSVIVPFLTCNHGDGSIPNQNRRQSHCVSCWWAGPETGDG